MLEVSSISLQSLEQRYQRSLLFLMFLGSALLRAISSLFNLTPQIYTDELVYWVMAHNLANGQWFHWRGEPLLFPSFLYPLLIAPASFVPETYQAFLLIKFLNALAMSSVVFPVYRLARMFMGPDRALFASLLGVLSPSMVYSSVIMAESLYYPTFVWGIYWLLRALQTGKAKHQLIAAVVWTLTFYVKVQGLVFLLLWPTGILILALCESRRGFVSKLGSMVVRFSPMLGMYLLLLMVSRLAMVIWLEGRQPDLSVASLLGTYAHYATSPGGKGFNLLQVSAVFLSYAAALAISLGIAPLLEASHSAYRGFKGHLQKHELLLLSLAFVATLAIIAFFTRHTLLFEDRVRIFERYFFVVAPLYQILFLSTRETTQQWSSASNRPFALSALESSFAALFLLFVALGIVYDFLSWNTPTDAPSLTVFFALKHLFGSAKVSLGALVFVITVGTALHYLKWKVQRVILIVFFLSLNVAWYGVSARISTTHRDFWRTANWVKQYVSRTSTVIYLCDNIDPRHIWASQFWTRASSLLARAGDQECDLQFSTVGRVAIVEGRLTTLPWSLLGDVWIVAHKGIGLQERKISDFGDFVLYRWEVVNPHGRDFEHVLAKQLKAVGDSPHLSIATDRPRYRRGDVLNVTVDLVNSERSRPVDAYLALAWPDGRFSFWDGNGFSLYTSGRWVPLARGIGLAKGVRVTNHPLLSLKRIDMPSGSYTWYLVLTESSAATVIAKAQAAFTLEP